MHAFISTVDRFNAAIGKAFGWYILILTFGVSYEVFVRYALHNPTVWAYDVAYNMYGALFIMAGAYTLGRNAHVRGDVVYRLMSERAQAVIDLALYVLFFFPGILSLTIAGYFYASDSWGYHELSVYTPADIPIFPLKTLIPIAGVTLLLQGLAEVCRCILCLKHGRWPDRLHDVEEIESAIMAEREYAEAHSHDSTGKGAST
jgi:TRAP-type mannitol/chloroaromatic compound transport system permease small subunit